MRKIVNAVVAVMMTVVLMLGSSNTYAQTEGVELRIGLLAKYYQKDSITICNPSVKMGYLREEGFVVEQVFASDDGFLFESAKERYVVSKETYKSYDEVVTVVNKLSDEGYKAFSGNKYKSVWRVYIEVASSKEGKAVAHKVGSTHKMTFDQVHDGGYRTKMTFSGITILIENVSVHPQFAPSGKEEIPAIDLGERQYRGRMEIGRYGEEGVTAINVVDVDEYLYSVVPSEMPRSWPAEVLKAQAVAARNYALYNGVVVPTYKSTNYHLSDTISSQAYKGIGSEYASTNAAVDDTAHLNIYYNNKLVPTFYSSTSGGHTEDSENVWVGRAGYLRGVPDIYELTPARKPWVKKLTGEEIVDVLKKKRGDLYEDVGKITDIEVEGYSEAGRVMNLKIIGTKGEFTLSKETIRWLDVYSRKFSLIKEDTQKQETLHIISDTGTSQTQVKNMYVTDSNGAPKKLVEDQQAIMISANNIHNLPLINGEKGKYIFVGQGNGHGIGMSQSGARGMAEAGFNFREILHHYYTNIEIR